MNIFGLCPSNGYIWVVIVKWIYLGCECRACIDRKPMIATPPSTICQRERESTKGGVCGVFCFWRLHVGFSK